MSVKTSLDSMQSLLVNLFGEKHRDFVVTTLNWRGIVGDYLANNSRVIKLDNQILFIGVRSSVVMQELILVRDSLRNKLNSTLALNIKDIVFFISEISAHKYGLKES